MQKARFLSLVDEYNSDVARGCKSHLDPSFYTSEIFLDTYSVFRKCLGKTVLWVVEESFVHKEIFTNFRRTTIGCGS